MTDETVTNVIKFPGVSALPLNQNEASERIELIRREYVETATEECVDAVIAIARNYNFFTNQNKINMNDIQAIGEMITSALLRYSGIDHPGQEIVDTIMFFDDDEETVATVSGPLSLDDFTIEQENI